MVDRVDIEQIRNGDPVTIDGALVMIDSWMPNNCVVK
jgi:hypothetical protein